MSSTLSFMLFAAVFLGAVVLFFSYKTGHFFKSLLLSAFSGIGSLFAVNILAQITGVSVGVNYISLALSGLFGIPGVIALLFIN